MSCYTAAPADPELLILLIAAAALSLTLASWRDPAAALSCWLPWPEPIPEAIGGVLR